MREHNEITSFPFKTFHSLTYESIYFKAWLDNLLILVTFCHQRITNMASGKRKSNHTESCMLEDEKVDDHSSSPVVMHKISIHFLRHAIYILTKHTPCDLFIIFSWFSHFSVITNNLLGFIWRLKNYSFCLR